MKKLVWLWWLIPLLGMVELAAHWILSARPPSVDDWQQVVKPVRELRTDGELVVVAPHWAEPNARRFLGDREMPLKDVARADESGYRRAIEISVLGGRVLDDWKLLQEQRHGDFTLRLLENPHFEQVHFRFIEHVQPQHLSVTSGKATCDYNERAKVSNGALHGHPTYPRQRFECGTGAHFVGVTVIEDQNYEPRHCIWANPDPGKALSLRFKQVELHTKLKGYGGISYFDERDGKGGGVVLEAYVNEEQLGTYQHHPGEGWTPFEFDTTPHTGERHDVEFRVRATKGRPRGFCFQADVR